MAEQVEREHFVISSSIFIALSLAQHTLREVLEEKKCIVEFDLDAEPIVKNVESDTRYVHVGVVFFQKEEKRRAQIDCHIYRLKRRWAPSWVRVMVSPTERWMITYSPPDENGFSAMEDSRRI